MNYKQRRSITNQNLKIGDIVISEHNNYLVIDIKHVRPGRISIKHHASPTNFDIELIVQTYNFNTCELVTFYDPFFNYIDSNLWRIESQLCIFIIRSHLII